MTAEIAVLNNAAVVLAADSAVSIGHGADAKIFNSANKIFEVGTRDPVALMVFNRLDYMGLPIEVLAKEFRSTRRDRAYSKLNDWVDDFLHFLKVEVPIHEADVNDQFVGLATQMISDLERRLGDAINQKLAEEGKVLKRSLCKLLTNSVLKPMIEALEGRPDIVGLSGLSLNATQREYVASISSGRFAGMNLTLENHRLIRKLVTLRLQKDIMSPMHTGLVFAGFGSDELCPTLIHVDIDGMIGTELKLKMTATVDIDRNGPRAEVMGFAQDDMVRSFVDGSDPYYANYSEQMLEDAVFQTAGLMLQAAQVTESQRQSIMGQLTPDLSSLAADLKRKLFDFSQRNFTDQVKQMVRLMPKDEMARLAESLIEITSLKRRVTRERETVGGQVDVAVLTKSEGLVWVKRKHYFPADINSRFFSRQRGD